MIGTTVMTQNANKPKNAKNANAFFLQYHKKIEMEIICILSHNFWVNQAPQNDRLNLSFVKDKHTDGKKMARNGRKMGVSYCHSFILRV